MLQHGDTNAIAMLLGIYFSFALMTLSTSTVKSTRRQPACARFTDERRRVGRTPCLALPNSQVPRCIQYLLHNVAGMWGHLRVAIKVFKTSLRDLAELGQSAEDFDREVLHHPHPFTHSRTHARTHSLTHSLTD
jgi:hypothetical protein